MSKTKIPISVIIPCFNCQKTIARAIDSIIEQTVLPEEILLIDDASTDKETLIALELIQEKFKAYLNIIIIQLNDNVGPGEARNIGWNRSRRPYIAFLDADDSWHPQKLELQYNWMASHPQVILSGHKCQVISPCNSISKKYIKKLLAEKVSQIELLHSNFFQTPSVMLRSDISYRFPKNKFYAEDYYLWLSIALDNNDCVVFKEPLAYLYKAPYGDSGLSGNIINMEQGELEAYSTLYRLKQIHILLYFWLVTYSLCKFIRRVFIVIYKKYKGRLTICKK